MLLFPHSEKNFRCAKLQRENRLQGFLILQFSLQYPIYASVVFPLPLADPTDVQYRASVPETLGNCLWSAVLNCIDRPWFLVGS